MKAVESSLFAKIEVGARRAKSLLVRKVVNIISALILLLVMLINKACPLSPMVFNGSCTTKLFEARVENELKAGQVVVMDNASFHKSQKTKDLIESIRCKIIFLTPNSPDLNPIEKFWANMKRWIKHRINEFNKLYDVLVEFFCSLKST